jgi:hypothetical protein
MALSMVLGKIQVGRTDRATNGTVSGLRLKTDSQKDRAIDGTVLPQAEYR